MPIRDLDLIEAWMAVPYHGYAIHRIIPDPGRIAACFAVLGTAVGAGVLLGRPRG